MHADMVEFYEMGLEQASGRLQDEEIRLPNDWQPANVLTASIGSGALLEDSIFGSLTIL